MGCCSPSLLPSTTVNSCGYARPCLQPGSQQLMLPKGILGCDTQSDVLPAQDTLPPSLLLENKCSSHRLLPGTLIPTLPRLRQCDSSTHQMLRSILTLSKSHSREDRQKPKGQTQQECPGNITPRSSWKPLPCSASG